VLVWEAYSRFDSRNWNRREDYDEGESLDGLDGLDVQDGLDTIRYDRNGRY
jgi:hypothetical protein